MSPGGSRSQRLSVTSMDERGALMWRSEGYLLVKWVGNPIWKRCLVVEMEALMWRSK